MATIADYEAMVEERAEEVLAALTLPVMRAALGTDNWRGFLDADQEMEPPRVSSDRRQPVMYCRWIVEWLAQPEETFDPTGDVTSSGQVRLQLRRQRNTHPEFSRRFVSTVRQAFHAASSSSSVAFFAGTKQEGLAVVNYTVLEVLIPFVGV